MCWTRCRQFSDSGHTISGNASVQRQIGEHFNVQLQYTRLHQSYSEIAAISSIPDRNVWSFTSRISFQDRWDASLKRYLW